MADSKEKLFSDFTAPSRQEWIDKINVDLKGADYQKKMVWRTNEGFNAEPFYRKEDLDGMSQTNALPGQFPYLRGNEKDGNHWYVRQNMKVTDAKESNAKALDLLNRGVTSLGFKIPAKKLSAEFIADLLDGIHAETVELNFRTCQNHTVELAKLLVAYFTEKGYDPAKIVGSIDFDPLQKILKKGKDTTALLGALSELVELTAQFPEFRCVSVNADTLCNAGAYIYQELGYALSWGNEYLHLMTEAGVPAAQAAKKIKFNMGISGVYFMEIAKFRAARMMWANIVKQYLTEGECECACKMTVNATTSTYNMTVFDSYVNLLRTQTETMSAALANVHSIVVTPFDDPYETPTEFAERIARNQQLLLQEESHFDKIVDVAGGSYFIETLTHSLAEEAWKLFLGVEEEGGFLATLKAGSVQNAINATDAARHANAGKRKEFMLGTNQFPNFTEKSENKQPKEEACCCHSHGDTCETPFAKLTTRRLAADFEDLRLQTEKAEKQPVAFMLTIGNLAMRQARAQFSCNFLACAGYKVIDNLGFPTVEEGVEAAMKAGADIVVLCSSDDEYAEYAIPAFKALDNRAMFVVAGAPACAEDLKAAGIENFIHVRVDQLKTLKEYNTKLGIK